MTTKHTATPWRVEEENRFPWDIRIVSPAGDVLMMRRHAHSSRDETLADVMACRDHGENREQASKANHEQLANAAFIVRACNAHDDLVAALVAVNRLIAKHGIGDDDNESEPVVNMIAAALAKANP